DYELKGFTSFHSSPTATHNYALKFKNGHLSVWLEDVATKWQWRSNLLKKEDFVTPENSIPNASIDDYI
ncbi:hypothetical protein PHYSODRAFT_411776, partial [Phytophthora sojae]